jgi:hypothetical protein
MDLFDTLTWAEILGKTTFLGTLTLNGAISIFRNLVARRDQPKSPEIRFLSRFS